MDSSKSKKILFPAVHLIGWLGYFFIPAIVSDFQGKQEFFRETNLWWIIQILVVITFYINYLVLIPKLLFKKKYLFYAIAVLVLMIGTSFFIEFIVQGFMHPEPQMINHSEPGPPKPPGDLDGPFRGISVFAIVLLLSTALRMSVEWFRNERQRKELENDKLKAELEALRAQIDPHFFFNVLNNICSLARKKSDDTEKFIIKLSELIRYNLYENKGEKFFLEKEITFLKNYIEIQKMRLDKNANINFDFSQTNQDLMIEPMLLYPFVENAFKHGISYQNTSNINITISTKSNILQFVIDNPHIKNQPKDKNSGGIGLQNVERRLKLLYPGKHKLEISHTEDIFTVSLIIEL